MKAPTLVIGILGGIGIWLAGYGAWTGEYAFFVLGLVLIGIAAYALFSDEGR